MKPSKVILLFFITLFSFGKSYAVLNENNLSQTLSELRLELYNEVQKMDEYKVNFTKKKMAQHDKMIEFIQRCNELSLVLYSQNQDWTFDMTYAYRKVTKEYNEFKKNRVPFDAIVANVDLEIDRFARLIESLRRLPPQLDHIDFLPDSLAYHNDSVDMLFARNVKLVSHDSVLTKKLIDAFFLDETGQQDRDSCVLYATRLLVMYATARQKIITDNIHYENTNTKLKESYDYAKKRFQEVRRSMFTEPVKAFELNSSSVVDECIDKYTRTVDVRGRKSKSEWRGTLIGVFFVVMFISLVVSLAICSFIFKLIKRKDFDRKHGYVGVCVGICLFSLINFFIPYFTSNDFIAMASNLLFTFSWIVDVILISILIKTWNSTPEKLFYFYLPIIAFSLCVFMMRIVLVSDSLINIFFPPFLAIAFICQLFFYYRYKADLTKVDLILGRVSLLVLFVALVLSILGYLFISLLIVIWWFLQIATFLTLMIFRVLIDYYRKFRGIDKLQEKTKGDNITATWFCDMLVMAVIPALYILSFVQCIWAALHVFDVSELYEEFVNKPLINMVGPEGVEGLYLTPYMVIMAIVLIFGFRYLQYFITSLYRVIRTEQFKKKTGKDVVLASDINLTLANNIIAIIVWGIYVIRLFILFRIPTGTIAMVSTGLAAGIGMAMRDIMNNFIYGIQLMSGRLRLGDWIECDGVRGKVIEISYQCTVLDTDDGAVISFLNADLLGKNFRNLTKTNQYEQLNLTFGISRGENIEKVRGLLLESLKSLQQKDSYGQLFFDPTHEFQLFFTEFGESRINVKIQLYSLVNNREPIEPMVKECIYNTLIENNIELPYPQRDVRIISSQNQ